MPIPPISGCWIHACLKHKRHRYDYGDKKKMMISDDKPKQLIRAEDGILADIWDALRKEDTIRSLDMGSFSIDVKGGEVYLKGYLPQEQNLPLIESIIHSVVGVVAVHNHLRTNASILADIWDALWKEDAIRALDMGSLSIKVKAGEVYLDGHLAQENNVLLIERIAKSVVGVVAVHNNLVADHDLTIQVAQALARDERTRSFIFPVRASHGWIKLGGEVPTRELQHVVETVAGGVPSVRGVIALPRVTGENPAIPSRAVQPRIGAVLYGKSGEVGTVSQVVIDPNNRLVTHVIVRSNVLEDGYLFSRETVVPIAADVRVNDKSIFLAQKGPSLNVYPVFNPDVFLPAPFMWKAPYPYAIGEVRWSFGQILETGNWPRIWPEMKRKAQSERFPKRATAQTGTSQFQPVG